MQPSQLTPNTSNRIGSLDCYRLVEQNQIAESLTVGPENKTPFSLSGKVAIQMLMIRDRFCCELLFDMLKAKLEMMTEATHL